jgi:ComF family protein
LTIALVLGKYRWKMSVLDSVIGWLSPPVCIMCGHEGRALCDNCSASEVIPFGIRCWRCGKVSPRSRTCESCRHTSSPAHVWISTDYEGASAKLLQLYKFGHQRAAVTPLVSLMAETFWQFNSSGEITKDYLLVPVATATSRVRERGFDHTDLLAKKISQQLQIDYFPVLGRLGQMRQVGAKRFLRLQQVEGQFYAKHPGKINARRIVLVDDVVTTGATLAEAAKVLRRAGAKSVDALVFAKKL